MRKRRARESKNSYLPGGASSWGPSWGASFGLSYDCLLCDFDPYLFSADAILARSVESIYHRKKERGLSLFALLGPAHNGCSWAISRVSKLFNLYVDSALDNDIAIAACEYFSATCVAGFEGNQIPEGLDLIISEYYAWSNPLAFVCEVTQCLENLNSSGVLICVLIGCEEAVSWADGSSIELKELLKEPSLPELKSSYSAKKIAIDDISDGLLREFLRRNKDYFSKLPCEQLRHCIMNSDEFLPVEAVSPFFEIKGSVKEEFVHILVF
jgi:hypothetical protein